MGLPRFGGHERCSAYNVGGELLDAVLCERMGEDGGLSACRSRAIDVQMATVHST